MSDPSPRITPTHAADEFQGAFFGIAASFLPWIGFSALASIGLFYWLYYNRELDFIEGLQWSLVPVALMVVYYFSFQRGKPPGYPFDLIDSLFTRGEAKPPNNASGRHVLFSNPFPDGYVADGAVVFEGPRSGFVAFGLLIEMPNLQSASGSEKNRVQDALSTILRLIPDGWSIQFREFDDNGDAALLLEYQQQSEHCNHKRARLLRNANFISLWERLERRDLRRKRSTVYLSRPLELSSSAWWHRPTESQYTAMLAEARSTFAEWSQTVSQALDPIGGGAIPMTDADLVRFWTDSLNPSFSERLAHDPAAHLDPHLSLAENCWHSELRGQGRQGFVIDGWHVLAITFSRLPSESFFTINHPLAYLPFDGITLTVHAHRLDKEKVLRRTQAALDRIHQQLLRKPDERLNVTRSQLEEKVRRLASGEVVPFEMEFIIIVRAKAAEELMEKAGAVKSAVQSMNGAQYYEATLSATSRNLFAKTLPAWMGSRHQGFRHYIEDRNLADLLPLSSTFQGHPGPLQALFPGSDHNLVNFVTFLGQGKDATPQNLIVMGAPGTGKSRMLEKLLFETVPLYGFTAIIEEGLSLAPFTTSFGFQPIIFRLDGTQTKNPLDSQGQPFSSFMRATLTAMVARMVGRPTDEEKARRQSARIASHIARLCEDHANDMLRKWPEELRLRVIRHALALDRWAKNHGVSDTEAFVDFREFQQAKPVDAESLLAQFTESDLREFESREGNKINDLVFAYLRPDEHLTLSSLREHFETEGEDDEESRWLGALLTPWCRGGNYGVLFDGISNVDLTDSPVLHYELGLIPEAAAKEIKTIVAFLIINGIRNHILNLPRLMWKRIVVEEVSRFLDIAGGEGEAILREFFEQFRKHYTHISISVQSYNRIADTAIRTALMGGARAFAIFNTGDRRDIERLGQDIGLSRVAQETILRFPRPDQQVGERFSEFLYVHTDPRQPICGPVRYVLLPHETIGSSTDPVKNH